MDKVYITKQEMYDSIETKAKRLKSGSNGPIITVLVWIWFLWALIFLAIPAFISLVLVVVIYAPFYIIDQKIVKRRDNG